MASAASGRDDSALDESGVASPEAMTSTGVASIVAPGASDTGATCDSGFLASASAEGAFFAAAFFVGDFFAAAFLAGLGSSG